MTADEYIPNSVGRIPLSKVLDEKQNMPSIVLVSPGEPVIRAIRLMNVYNISQIPVVDNGQVVGSVSEASVMRSLYDGSDSRDTDVRDVMDDPLPQLDQEAEIADAYAAFLGGAPGVMVLRNGFLFGVLTRTDLIAYWAFQADGLQYHI